MSKKEEPQDTWSSINKQELVSFINHLFKEGRIFEYEINDLLKSKKLSIPLSAFDNIELSALETVAKYLKENQHKTYHEIALLLNRDDRTIWTTYNKSLKKRKKPLIITPSEPIPLEIFSNRTLAVLQSLVVYLKDSVNLTYHEIAVMLHRNDRTIWTTYHQAKKRQLNV